MSIFGPGVSGHLGKGDSGVRCLREWELAEFGRRELAPRIGAEISSIDLAVATVASGGRYALCVVVTYRVGDDVRFVPSPMTWIRMRPP